MYKYKAEPLSNDIIMTLTRHFRKMLGCGLDTPLDIVAILEFAMPQIDKNFGLLIKTQDEMKIDSHAYTDPETQQIVIREDIYDRARNGEGRDRFTIAHEIGHYLLHNHSFLTLTRVYKDEEIKPYEDVEWQADAFAGELLCPAFAVKDMSAEDAAIKYGVSIQAAKTQIRKSRYCFQSQDC